MEIVSVLQKQKLSMKSGTEAESVGADDASSLVLWTNIFLEAQGYKVEKDSLYQNNKISILIQENSKNILSKRKIHLNMRCFFSRINFKR